MSENQLGKHWLVWGVLLAGIPFYAIFGLILSGDSPVIPVTSGQYDIARSAAVILALILVVGLRKLRSALVRRAAVAAGQGRDPLGPYMLAVLLPTAGCEIVAFIGLALFLMGSGPKTLYGFTIGAAVLILAYRPKTGEFEYIKSEGDSRS